MNKEENGAQSTTRVAVVDIGSNTVRLVVFDARARIPIPLFNEKTACELGRNLDATGVLNPEGLILAREALARYFLLTEAMGLDRVHLLATAAVREARDGGDFADEVSALFGVPVAVLSGEEEARLSGLGVLCSNPRADGVVGDLGGGSLDFIALENGTFAEHATLPMGHLRVMERTAGKASKVAEVVRPGLAGISWLDGKQGQTLYAVGGSWRAVASYFMAVTKYPLHVIDNYAIPGEQAETLAKQALDLTGKALDRLAGVSGKRKTSLPYAAALMAEVIARMRPRQVVFSGYGMREGRFFDGLPEDTRADDPLLAACRHISTVGSRFGSQGDEIFAWMSPLFLAEAPEERRIRLATCLVSDIAWYEHPDYRADHAFQRVLRLPVAGISHRDRIAMAYAVGLRHGTEKSLPTLKSLVGMLSPAQTQRVRVIGQALRLANTLSGGVSDLLPRTALSLSAAQLTLTLPRGRGMFTSEVVDHRLGALATTLGVSGQVVYQTMPG